MEFDDLGDAVIKWEELKEAAIGGSELKFFQVKGNMLDGAATRWNRFGLLRYASTEDELDQITERRFREAELLQRVGSDQRC